jgi:poly-gamma-glutamate capsule biosynthesis protein CapA/YwtB (metallophosphatase superfamily)
MSTNRPPDRDARRRAAQQRRVQRRRQSALLVAAGLLLFVLVVWTAVGGTGGNSHTGTTSTGTSGTRTATSGTSTGAATVTGTTATATVAPLTAATAAAKVAIAGVGDTMMGSPPWGLPPANGRYLFSAVKGDLVGNVITGNLEGTLTGPTGTSKCGAGPSSTCFAFRSPPSYAFNLKSAGFTVMNGANNHSHDFGVAGQVNTARALKRAGILYTGPPGTIAIQHVGGVSVAVLGFAPYNWANDSTNLPGVAALVRKAAHEATLVIVHVHAGAEGVGAQHVHSGTEYYLGENRGNVLAFAHTAIAAGADLVIGSGPHVLRGMQFWHGRLIAYSMGNFVGYRAFGLGGVLSQSAVLQVTLRGDGRFVSGRIRPVELSGNGVPYPGGYAISDIRTLSQQDFGASAAHISANGVITAPRA